MCLCGCHFCQLGQHPLANLQISACEYIMSLVFFLWPHLQHMEIPGLGVELGLQLPTYATATAMATSDPSHLCDPHHNLQHCQILNPMRQGQGLNFILKDTMSGSQPAKPQQEPQDACSRQLRSVDVRYSAAADEYTGS